MKSKYLWVLLVFVVITLAVVFKTTADYKEISNDLEEKLQTINELQDELEIVTTTKNADLVSFNDQKIKFQTELKTSIESYENKIKDLELLIAEGNIQISELMLPDEGSRYMLKEMGINDSTVLVDNLMDLGQDIISYKGVLGGTMHFYNIKILNNKWAFARFEDGHYGGYGIYEFDLVNDQIEWQVVVEYRD